METFNNFKRLIILTLCFSLSSTISYSQYSIDSRIRASSIVIQSSISTGSGFFLMDTLSKYLYVVTASHVLVNNNNPQSLLPDTILITGYRENVDADSSYMFKVGISDCINSGNFGIDLQNDIAVIRFAKLIDMGTYTANRYPNFVVKLTKDTKIESWPMNLSISIEEIIPGSDLFVIGFPQSLGLQGKFDMNRPLMRKGIVFAAAGVSTKPTDRRCLVCSKGKAAQAYQQHSTLLKTLSILSIS